VVLSERRDPLHRLALSLSFQVKQCNAVGYSPIVSGVSAKIKRLSDETSRNTILKKAERSEYSIPNRYKIPRRKPYTSSLLKP